MLDLDLDDLEAPVSRIEQVSPLGAYQGSRVVNPQAVSHEPVAPGAVTYSTATAMPQPKAPLPPQSMLLQASSYRLVTRSSEWIQALGLQGSLEILMVEYQRTH